MAAQCDALGQDLQAARAPAHALQVCLPFSPTPLDLIAGDAGPRARAAGAPCFVPVPCDLAAAQGQVHALQARASFLPCPPET